MRFKRLLPIRLGNRNMHRIHQGLRNQRIQGIIISRHSNNKNTSNNHHWLVVRMMLMIGMILSIMERLIYDRRHNLLKILMRILMKTMRILIWISMESPSNPFILHLYDKSMNKSNTRSKHSNSRISQKNSNSLMLSYSTKTIRIALLIRVLIKLESSWVLAAKVLKICETSWIFGLLTWTRWRRATYRLIFVEEYVLRVVCQ